MTSHSTKGTPLHAAIRAAARRDLLPERRLPRSLAEHHIQLHRNLCEAWSFHRQAEKPKRGTRTLEGKTAAECVRVLTSVIPTMGNETTPDYWQATEWNAKMALVDLLTIAVAVPPDAICIVSY